MNDPINPLASSVLSGEMFTVNLTDKNLSRFWIKVDKKGPDDCWLWTSAVSKNGYGVVTINWKALRPHRVSYFIANGEFLTSLMVCHRCDTKLCVNPKHLFLGTGTVNVHDMLNKGRGRWKNVMTMEKASQIRSAYATGGVTMQNLSDRFGTCIATVCNIINYKSWIPSTP